MIEYPIKMFDSQALSTSNVTLYTVAGATTMLVIGAGVRFVNTDGSARMVTVYISPVGGSPSATEVYLDEAVIPADEHLDVSFGNLKDDDRIIAAIDSGVAVTAHALGARIYIP